MSHRGPTGWVREGCAHAVFSYSFFSLFVFFSSSPDRSARDATKKRRKHVSETKESDKKGLPAPLPQKR